jgi:hypothetical protein
MSPSTHRIRFDEGTLKWAVIVWTFFRRGITEGMYVNAHRGDLKQTGIGQLSISDVNTTSLMEINAAEPSLRGSVEEFANCFSRCVRAIADVENFELDSRLAVNRWGQAFCGPPPDSGDCNGCWYLLLNSFFQR